MNRIVTFLFVGFIGFLSHADCYVSKWIEFGDLAFDDSLCYSHNSNPMPLKVDALKLVNGDSQAEELGCEYADIWFLPSTNDVVVVGDIVSVNLISIVGFDAEERFTIIGSCRAWYRIGVKVRKVNGNGVNIDGFSFPASYVCGLPNWPFYRGTTFEFTLRPYNNKWCVFSCKFVHPYPPFLKQGVDVLFPAYASSEIMSFGKQYDIDLSTNEVSMLIRYADGNVVLYRSGPGIFANRRTYKNFFDFSKTRMYLKESPDKIPYWNNTWIRDVKIEGKPYLTRLTEKKGDVP